MRKTLLALAFLLAGCLHLYAAIARVCAVKLEKFHQQLPGGFSNDFSTGVYDPIPCILTDKTPGAQNVAGVLIDTVPQQADIIVDGVVIGKTPARVVFEQFINERDFTHIEITLRKQGYKDITVHVGSGGRAVLERDPSQPLPPLDVTKGDDLPPIQQGRCGPHDWVDAFHPQEGVHPKPTDKCPADRSRPLFTREGTLACSDFLMYNAAYNSMTLYKWSIAPSTLGVDPSKLPTDHPVTPEGFGCTIYHDGAAVRITEQRGVGVAKTNIGWISEQNLRN